MLDDRGGSQTEIFELDTTIEIYINFSRAVNHDISSHLIIIKESSLYITDSLEEEVKLLVETSKELKKILNSIDEIYSSLDALKKYYEEVFETVGDVYWNTAPTPVKLKRRSELVEKFNIFLKKLQETMSAQMRVVSYNLQMFTRNIKKHLFRNSSLIQEEVQEEVNAASQALLDIERILESLAEISSMGKLLRERVQLTTILSNIERIVKRSLRASGRGKLIYPDKFPPLWVNRSDFTQIFYNLINNSIKYRRENIKLEISVEFDDGEIDYERIHDDTQQLYLKVSDNGIGISNQDRERVFEPGVRLKTNTSIPGTGMGLANIKAIIQRYKGKIWIEKNYLKQGIVVIMTIPKKYLYDDYYLKKD